MRLTVTRSRLSTLELVEFDLAPEDCAKHFSTFDIRADKDGEAIIPAIFSPCPPTCRNNGKPKSKDCGGAQPHRLGANVSAMTAFGVDLDHLAAGQLAGVLEALTAKGITFYWWNTFSHAPPFDCRARVIIPFLEPLPIASASQWSKVAWPALVKFFGLDGQAAADSACSDPARVYYLPSKPDSRAERAAGSSEGTFFDPLPLLGHALAAARVPTVEAAPRTPVDPSKPVDLADVRARLGRLKKNPTTVGIVRRVLAGESPTPAPDKRTQGDPSRYVAWRSFTGALAWVAEDSEASEALLEVARPAYTAEVSEADGDATEWATIVQLLETARAGAPAIKAQAKADKQAGEEIFRTSLGLKHGGEDPADPDPKAQGPQEWTKGLLLIERKTGIEIKSCQENAEHILRLSPQWANVLRYNEMSKRLEVHGGPLAAADEVRSLTDQDPSRAADWLGRTYAVSVSDHIVRARMEAIAYMRPYNPLQDYIRSLKHDGCARLKSMFQKYFNAKTVDADGKDISLHVMTIGIKWMVSAVARAMEPGCKVDVVLELEGGQGKKKSTALSVLGGEWFTDAVIDVHSKDACLVACTNWIIEMAELETFRKSEATAQKAFFSKRFDEYRPPYGHALVRTPRCCVLVGTTNTDDYLNDPTGNRRHWPITVGEIDISALVADRDQLWAEAAALYYAGVQWWLTPEESIVAEEQAQERVGADVLCDAIVEWLIGIDLPNRPAEITTKMLCDSVLQNLPGRGSEMRLGSALRKLGFTRKRVWIGGVRSWVYSVPYGIREAVRPPQKSTAARIAEAKGISIVKGGGDGTDDE